MAVQEQAFDKLEIRALPNGGYLVLQRTDRDSGSFYFEPALAGFTTVGEALKWINANIRKQL